MREARIENRSIPLRLGAAPSGKPAPRRGSGLRPGHRRGVCFQVQHTRTARMHRLDTFLPLVEHALQTAGYLVLTVGAAVLMFHFAP